jgi:teichuronic acid biosynthesis glycosyltransferase TuaG
VIPCYRCAGTVGRAVASVVHQTLPPAEIILVDDGSGDDTPEVLRRQTELYPSSAISVIELTKNAGPGAARNAGWEVATKPYVAFLDADDAWHPCKIEVQYNWMREHPQVAMSGHATTIGPIQTGLSTVNGPVVAHPVLPWQMLLSNRFPARSVMLKRALPFRFEPKKIYSEDYLLWLTIILSGYETWRLESALAFSFRPEYSPGGYSGALYAQERRELSALRLLHKKGLLSMVVYWLVSALSLIKYLRRQLISLADNRRRQARQ